MRKARVRSVRYAVVIALFLASMPACRALAEHTGIGVVVVDPPADSPEATVRAALLAAMQEDEAKGWKAFRALLHPSQLTPPRRLQDWRRLRFERLRKQWPLYVLDPARASFRVVRQRKRHGGRIQLYVANRRSTVPTPCTLAPRPGGKGGWAIVNCSL